MTIKRVVVAALDELPLKNENALHKFKLLAGPRWTPVPPADAGVSDLADWGNGFIKISCEDFPKPSMNLKWASDTLNRLISEANVRTLFYCPSFFFVHFLLGLERNVWGPASRPAPRLRKGEESKEGRPHR